VNRRQALTLARETLATHNIEDASLEGEILLRHVLGLDRSGLFSELEKDILPEELESLKRFMERRRKGEPSAYITGHREFFGLDFHVDRNVLIPRPETELLVEKVISLAECQNISTVADVGTGCGAIAISLAVNLPGILVYATDISITALDIARQNCRQHGVSKRICLLPGNLLEPVQKPVDLIIANLPYVRESELTDNGPLCYEPALALNGGKIGVDIIKKLCHQAVDKLRPGGTIFLEIGQGQTESVITILKNEFPTGVTEVHRDLAGIERIICMSLTSSLL
jgi:release factor glutamine methyltransferase